MIKRLSLISMFSILPASFYFAQTTVFAYLKDADGKPIERAQIDLKGEANDVTADKIGYFQFVDLKAGHYQIVVSKPNFETKTLEFEVSAEKKKDLGVITLYSSLYGADQGLAILDNNGDDETNNQSSTVGLLQSSRDVFNRIASYDLGAYWFRPRGIDGRSSDNMMNGVSMVKLGNGNVDFSNWGGLNEITRYPEIAANHAPSEYAFGGVAGVIYKNTKASEYRKGFQATYSLTNRNYRQRLSLRYTSGMSKSGWAFTVMGAKRWAEEGIQEGTFYDSYGTYLGVEKKFSDSHTMTFNAFVSPTRRSTSSPNTKEVYDLRGVHYNAFWGWQNGEKRSERVRNTFQPIFQLQDFWKINEKSQLWTSVSYQFGKDKRSRFDWQNVANPSPTYYKNLPSYALNSILYGTTNLNNPDPNAYSLEDYNTMLNNWTSNNQQVTQINWDNLYAVNQRNDLLQQQEVFDKYGLTGKKSKYFLVNDVNDDKVWNASTHYTYNFNDNARFLLNVSYQNFRSEYYREINDLLGGDFALAVDPFAESNRPGSNGLYDMNDASFAKREGDKINYNYILRRQEVKVNPGFKLATGPFDIFVSALFGYSTSSREGKFKHYLYQNNSFGEGKDHNFFNAGLKGQVVYRLNGRNFLIYNGAHFTQAPFLDDIYINPRLNNYSAPGIKNATITANDISYVMSTPTVKLRLSGYLIDTQNDTGVSRFYADGLDLSAASSEENGITENSASAFVTQVMTNVNKRNMGAELGLDVKILPTLSFQGVANWGDYTYQNNPTVYFASDVIATPYIDYGKTNIKGMKIGGTPQKAFSAGLRYSSPKFWWVGASWNYLDDNNLDPSALLRSESFIQSNFSSTPISTLDQDKVDYYMQQRKLPSASFINANVGKSWMIGRYYVLISATVNNILDNTKYITGGFEQIRNSKGDVNFENDYNSQYPNFAPKFWHTQGRSYFVNLQVRF